MTQIVVSAAEERLVKLRESRNGKTVPDEKKTVVLSDPDLTKVIAKVAGPRVLFVPLSAPIFASANRVLCSSFHTNATSRAVAREGL